MMLAREAETPLKTTPLHALHAACGGKMVPFAGYDMPVQFAAGVLREHLHTRKSAGLFDVSHMGQIALWAKSGRVEDAARALERLVPQDIVAVAPGRQRYAQFTDAAGGILDDLMVANFGSHLFLVVNAACKTEDEAHLRAQLSDDCIIEPLGERALIALQGPKAESALAKLCPDVTAMRFMDAGRAIDNSTASSRARLYRRGRFRDFGSGHRRALAKTCWRRRAAIGLGARDSLRLEPGLPTATISTPRHAGRSALNGRSEAAAWRRRANGFPARTRSPQLEQGAPAAGSG
jgi:aminomethyltransferase